MRIKTRIKLSIIFSLVLVATIALLLFLGSRAVNEKSRMEGIAIEVMKGVAEMKIVAHEYMLHPEERSLMQWRSKYGSLSKLLTGGYFKNSDEKIVADQIFMNLERFKTVFSDLTAGLRKGQALGKQESSTFCELQDRLTGELLVKSQLAVSLAFQLQQKIEAESAKTQKRVSSLTLFLLLTLTAIIVGISLWVNRSVARPIAKLEKDTQIIGRGNLDHKVGTLAKDEIGELSRAFDKMTQDLKETTTSIVELNERIDERKQVEKALRESEALLQAAMDRSQAGIAIADAPDGKLRYVNNSGLGIGGKTKEELVNGIGIDQYVASWQILHFDGTPYKDDEVPLARAIMYGEVCSKEFIVRRPEEEDSIVLANAAPIFDDKGEVFAGIVVFLDITDRKQTEDALRKSEEKLARADKLEAMGLMAGGVAHDLNNILSGIVSYPELLLMDLPEDSPLRKPIKTIQESGMRAADVVKDLLTIARGVASGKEILNLNTLVTEYLASAEHQKLERIHPLITFKTELDSDLLNITGSSSHVKKILMNLIGNASEAIEDKGTVTASTMNRYLDEPLKGYEDVDTGEYVMLTVSDDGSGISSDDLERIFEPFYTKKVMGRSGTGLGLAVVWNSMQDHGGYINVNTSEKGTTFELYFPTTREQIAADKEEVPLDDYIGHGEKILVVDDEERQGEIAGGILTRLGYTAETVSSGEEAIEYIKENAVDLIVLDMVMPKGIGGCETFEKIIKIHPGQKAIIASGYAKTKEVEMAQDLGAGKYIMKPYTLAKVGAAVKEELGK